MRLSTLVLSWALALGCSSAAPEAERVDDTHTAQELDAVLHWQTFGHSVQGRPIVSATLGPGQRTVLLVATIRGSEAAGTPLLERLAQELLRHPALLESRRVVLVPCLNPDGRAGGRRRNANRVDLNRNFPGPSWSSGRGGAQPGSEPETRALCELLERERPALVLSLHQPLACIDPDGNALDVARAMAATSSLALRDLPAHPGSLGSYGAQELEIPVITLELPGGSPTEEALWQAHGRSLLAAIRWPDPLESAP